MTIAMQIINPLFGGFIPTDIPGLQLWLDANDPTTLFQDSGLTTPAVLDGDPIGGWGDKSSNANNGVQVVGAKRPTLRTGVFLGKPIARFDGVDDIILYPTINALPATLFIVMVEQQIGLRTMIGHKTANIGFEAVSISGRVVRIVRNGVLITSSAIDTAIPNISAFDINTTNVNLYYNNINIGTASHTQTSLPINAIGTRNGFELFDGDVAELLIYNFVLSQMQRNDINTYLKTKWGI